MSDPELDALRLMVTHATEQCTDPDLLDFIYKLLIHDSAT